MPGKQVCIHAHFYQPPRENPWLEAVETEKSAAPYHDWNARITHECYAPNGAARILRDGRILEIVNNYEKMSFNFGPTLLSWLEKNEPGVYRGIIDADKKSVVERSGHGNAIAQVYNHSIMPLNSSRDKETQVIWGIRDFEHRFGRKPEGIWFAETAVDRESLLIAAKHGIKFTILAPSQAKAYRPLEKGGEWKDANGDIDTTRPYIYKPDNTTSIAVFFYDGELSTGIAFKGLLNDGQKLATEFMNRLGDDGKGLVHAATDGESYGHHHRFGEMALAVALRMIEDDEGVKVTNYGEFLENFPPDMEADIHDDSSWSCAHGVERWRSDCGCHISGGEGWNQKWRAPLRYALNGLKEKLDAEFEKGVSKFIKNPWEARNGYIDVLLERSPEAFGDFLKKHSIKKLSPHQVIEAAKYFEMQRSAMRMFTSCGWFFDDVSGLETVQDMKYAARAIDLQQDLSGVSLEEEFVNGLSKAISNEKGEGNGADIYIKRVTPLRLEPGRVAAHKVMMNALHKESAKQKSLYCYEIDLLDNYYEEYLDTELSIGRLFITSTLTLEEKEFVYCLLHIGGHDFNCSVKPYSDSATYNVMKKETINVFHGHSMAETIHAVERNFGGKFYTLKDLFDDERRKIMPQVMSDRISQFGDAYRSLFESNRNLMDYFVDINVPIPVEFKVSARYVFEKRLNLLFKDDSCGAAGVDDDIRALSGTLKDAKRWSIHLNMIKLERHFTAFLERSIEVLCMHSECGTPVCTPTGCGEPTVIAEAMALVKKYEIEIDLWKVQNMLYPYLEASRDGDNPLHKRVVAEKQFEALFEIFNFYSG